jgi:hypothetical protein
LPINCFSQLCIWQSWRPLRSSADACGARAGGTGSAGCAGRRRIVAALGRGSLLWAPTKRGREHPSQTTCRDAAPGTVLAASKQAKLASFDLSTDTRARHARNTPQSGNAAARNIRRFGPASTEVHRSKIPRRRYCPLPDTRRPRAIVVQHPRLVPHVGTSSPDYVILANPKQWGCPACMLLSSESKR